MNHPLSGRLSAGVMLVAISVSAVFLSACQADGQGAGVSVENSSAFLMHPTSSLELIQAMHARYADSWYEMLTFEQETIEYRADRADTSSWYEAMIIPGRLRIDIGAPSSGNAYIFRNDSLYVFSEGNVVVARQSLHPLLLLGFDVYRSSPEILHLHLDSLGFDLDVFSESDWQGRRAYVVGAETGDESRPQFWIDKERLVFVRMLQPAGPDGASQQEVQFNGYQELGGGWIAPEVDFYLDGTLTMTERYSEIEIDMDLDSALFSPETALQTRHWVEPEAIHPRN